MGVYILTVDHGTISKYIYLVSTGERKVKIGH